ncbi:MAG: phosphoribosyltransferase [Armatimonadetes bacterium]|nr:phosphoribosyltransferase [Armatimonadota bacterium]
MKKIQYDIITWHDFNSIISTFVDSIKEDKFDAILTIAKGGLIPAVALSHKLNIDDFNITRIRRNLSNEPFSGKIPPLVDKFDFAKLQGKRILIVDDIVGTGETLKKLIEVLKSNNIIDFKIFVLVKFVGEYSPDGTIDNYYFGKICNNWVIFPWEEKRC